MSRIFDGVTHVWLDLDDTLIDFEHNSRVALAELYDIEGLSRWFSSSDEWVEIYERHNKQLWTSYASGAISRDFLRLDRFMHPLKQAGVAEELSAELSRRFDPLYLDLLAQQKRVLPGAVDLLEAIHRKGMATGVLSNGFAEVQYRKIASAGLDKHIDHVVLSDDIGVNKPDVRIYRHAEQSCGAPSHAIHLMIGDNLDTDIAGAIAAGWRAIWLARHEPNEAVPCGAECVRSLYEIEKKMS